MILTYIKVQIQLELYKIMECKDIVKEWQEEFPILSKYTPSTLFAQAGIVLIGLRLDRRWSDMYDEMER